MAEGWMVEKKHQIKNSLPPPLYPNRDGAFWSSKKRSQEQPPNQSTTNRNTLQKEEVMFRRVHLLELNQSEQCLILTKERSLFTCLPTRVELDRRYLMWRKSQLSINGYFQLRHKKLPRSRRISPSPTKDKNDEV